MIKHSDSESAKVHNRFKQNIIIALIGIFLIFCIATMYVSNRKGFNLNKLISNDTESIESTDENEELNKKVGKRAKISSIEVTNIKTGAKTFENHDKTKNESFDTNNIFDEISYTLDIDLDLKGKRTKEKLNGGKIMLKARIPDKELSNLVEWDLDSMKWLEEAEISNDGRTLTGVYSLVTDGVTVPGEQTLKFVLKVEGVANGKKIKPIFTAWLYGNENSKKSITADKIIVNSVDKYNVIANDEANEKDKQTTSPLIGKIKTQNEKMNYNLAKNESKVVFEIMTQFSKVENIEKQLENCTLKAEVILPKGISYKEKSSKVGAIHCNEPIIVNNEDGTTKLTYVLYNCTSDEDIEPITFETYIDYQTKDGTQYTVKLVESEFNDSAEKFISNSEVSINVINMSNYGLYREIESEGIETGENISYKVVFANTTESINNDFQLLDILPYNGDSRGTNYTGKYKIKNISVNQTRDGKQLNTNNLNLYVTNSESVRKTDAKDKQIGISNIWSEKDFNVDIDQELTAVALKGSIPEKTTVELNILLDTDGNKEKDTYVNTAMAQIYTDSMQIETRNSVASVTSRTVEGTVWKDSDKNGLIGAKEKKLEGIEVKLLDSANNIKKQTTTDSEGKYLFNELDKGIYKVEISYPERYYITEKGIGVNSAINSKFNKDTNQTDELIALNDEGTVEIAESNINAGLCNSEYELQIKKYETGTDEVIPNVDFLILGETIINGKSIYTTNENGIINIPSLELGELYTIKETYAKGYYLDETEFTVKLVSVNGNLELEYNGREAKRISNPVVSDDKTVVEIDFENVNIPKYSLELTNLANITEKLLDGTIFEISGAGREETEEKEYVTKENGKILIENLYENEEYTLKEILPAKGYKPNEETIKFKGTLKDGQVNLEIISGKFLEDPVLEGTKVKAKWKNEALLRIEKRDSETGEPLSGAKFVIKDVDGNYAKDAKGNELGLLENINGEDMKVVTTDSEGLFVSDIEIGLYDVTEVQAPEGYNLPEVVTKRIEITEAIREKLAAKSIWGGIFGGTDADTVERVVATSDGGIILAGYFKSSTIDLGNKIKLNHTSENTYDDGMIVKYNRERKVEWAVSFGNESSCSIVGIIETEDKGLLVCGNITSRWNNYIR